MKNCGEENKSNYFYLFLKKSLIFVLYYLKIKQKNQYNKNKKNHYQNENYLKMSSILHVNISYQQVIAP